jgi:16S rRNA (cytosine1402-N4)-methyltransferase
VTLYKTKTQEKMHQNPHNNHIPVLLAEIIEYVNPKKDETYLDVTAGYGGHSSSILSLTNNYKKSVLVDRDDSSIKILEEKYSQTGIALMHQDYLSASYSLVAQKRQFDLIVADLGVSSPHLNEGNRGFSFKKEGPLDMRMDQRQSLTARDIVNTYSEEEIVKILWKYGEEPKSRQIARLIVKRRPIMTTLELAQIVKIAWPGISRTHPAKRTFQALRIAVNDELRQLNEALPLWVQLLAPNGRIAVISFHSLEDRIVKSYFVSESGDRYDSSLNLLTKRPIIPSAQELANNPRARSAKLRIAVKQK